MMMQVPGNIQFLENLPGEMLAMQTEMQMEMVPQMVPTGKKMLHRVLVAVISLLPTS